MCCESWFLLAAASSASQHFDYLLRELLGLGGARRRNDENATSTELRADGGRGVDTELVGRDQRVHSVAGRHLLRPLRRLRPRLLSRSGLFLSLCLSIC